MLFQRQERLAGKKEENKHMTKHAKLGLGATAGLVAAVATLMVLVGSALAAGTASLDQPTAAADGTATVTLKMAAPAGSGVGNWAFDVGFDPTKFTGDPTCAATNGDCTVKPAGAAGIVRFGGFAGGAGLTGDVTVGTITFDTNLTTGCADLTLAIAAAAGSAFQDQNGTDFASPTFTAGKVCAPAAATTAAATAAATTAAALPQTGGPSSDGSFQLGWLAAAAGALIVVAAGAWTLARAREDS
jgi:hypothetical protein